LHATAVANLGRVNEQKGNYKAALQQHIQALETFRQLDEKSKLIEQYHAIAEAYYKLDENGTASLYADSSLNLALNVGRWNGIEAAYLLKSNIQERLNNPRAALEFFRQAMLYRDSILNEESLKNIAEMDALYELGVKNERINSLEAENRWAKTRATGLTIGLLLVFIIGALSAGLLWMRNRKNQKIRAKEKEVEAEKIKNLDLEKKRLGERLDHLKRELSSQVLFLCQKNDLLAKVQKEIEDISLVDTTNKKQLTRIVRQIDHNIESEQEWEHFMNTFVEVHPNFLKELKSNFPELTTKECRLAALFKLNLSTKEIASLLHISPDSVKKARTRFRKKLNLDSSVDLEEFLMLFPAN
jgi:DNA-binding CsgD family transcriptional regulator